MHTRNRATARWLAWWHEVDEAALRDHHTTSAARRPAAAASASAFGFPTAAAAARADMLSWQRALLARAPAPLLLRVTYYHAPGRVALAVAFQSCGLAYRERCARLEVERGLSGPGVRCRYLNALVR